MRVSVSGMRVIDSVNHQNNTQTMNARLPLLRVGGASSAPPLPGRAAYKLRSGGNVIIFHSFELDKKNGSHVVPIRRLLLRRFPERFAVGNSFASLNSFSLICGLVRGPCAADYVLLVRLLRTFHLQYVSAVRLTCLLHLIVKLPMSPTD